MGHFPSLGLSFPMCKWGFPPYAQDVIRIRRDSLRKHEMQRLIVGVTVR